MLPRFIFVLGIISQTACLTGRTAVQVDETPQDVPILWERSGQDDRIQGSIRYVAYDEKALARLPLAEVPVDFRTQMVLIAAAGPFKTPDTQIRIKRLWTEGTRIRTHLEIIHPSQAPSTTLRRHCPWHVVVVPRSELNIEGFSTSLPEKAFASGGPG
jgi:hypothetical protein